MSLRVIAEEDNRKIMSDTKYGFAWNISITDPEGNNVPDLTGLSGDIGLMIDPDTGQAITGRFAHISINIGLLTDNGLDIPKGIAEKTSKPWVIEFNDISGKPYKFKVSQSNPDRTLGLVSCILEQYDG